VDTALRRLVDDDLVLRHVKRLRGSGALDPARVAEARRQHVEWVTPAGTLDR
jgi:hypothetical protein